MGDGSDGTGIFNNLKKRSIPWIKIDGTLGRWEAKGFSEKFRNELAVIRGKKQITTEEFDKLVTLANNSHFVRILGKLQGLS